MLTTQHRNNAVQRIRNGCEWNVGKMLHHEAWLSVNLLDCDSEVIK
jgi:hypothetical protein